MPNQNGTEYADSAAVGENEATTGDRLEQQRKRTNVFTIIVLGSILASFGFQGIAIALNYKNILILISGVASVAVTSTVAVKQIIMQRMDTLRSVHNKIRMEVNRFMEENNKLTRNVDGLEDQVMKLQGVENDLAKIAEKQNISADELIVLVKENGAILKEQKVRLVYFILIPSSLSIYLWTL